MRVTRGLPISSRSLTGGGGGGAVAGVVRPSAANLTTLAGAPSYDGDGVLTMTAGDAVVGAATEQIEGFLIVAKATSAPTTTPFGLVMALGQGDGTNARAVGVSLRSVPRSGTLDGLWSASPLSSIWGTQSASYSSDVFTADGFEALLTVTPGTASPRLFLSGRREGTKINGGPRDVAEPAGWTRLSSTWGSKRIVLACTQGTWEVYWINTILGAPDIDLSAL